MCRGQVELSADLFQDRFSALEMSAIVQAGADLLRFRYVPVMGQLPFLLSPLVENNDDLMDIYGGVPRRKVTRISFMVPPGLPRQYGDSFTIRLYRAVGSSRNRPNPAQRQ